MSDTVKLPGLGETKKSTVYVLGAVLVVVVGVGFYRSRHASSSASSGSADQAQAEDPATGYPAGSAEDQAALAAQASAAQAQGAYGGYGGGANYSTGGTPPQGFTTNAQWSQAAEDYLVNTVHSGNNADVIGNALGKYITGQPLTADQVAIVEQAIAFTGYPPVNGPTGYPPSYRTAQETSGGGGGGGGSSLTAPGAPSISAIDKHGATLRWTAAAGAAHYVIYYRMNGQSTVHKAGTSGGTSFRIGYFHPATRLSVWVNAVDSHGHQGPPSSATSFATHH